MADGNTDITIAQDASVVVQPVQSLTPMDMLSNAVSSGADITVIERLMQLNDSLEEKQSKRAFIEALSAAKSKIKPIVKRQDGHKIKYAGLDDIATHIDPILSEHGLSYRFRTAQESERIIVTCIVSHREGHSEETTLSAMPDASGSKQGPQAIGSTVTYLQRYTLNAAFGLSATKDDDGQLASNPPKQVNKVEVITSEQAVIIRKLLAEKDRAEQQFVNYVNRAWKWGVESVNDVPADQYEATLKWLNSVEVKANATG